jgi:hypothetical protein
MYKIIEIDFELFVQEKMFLIKHIGVHWINLMTKKIISKFQRLEILNQIIVKVKEKL